MGSSTNQNQPRNSIFSIFCLPSLYLLSASSLLRPEQLQRRRRHQPTRPIRLRRANSPPNIRLHPEQPQLRPFKSVWAYPGSLHLLSTPLCLLFTPPRATLTPTPGGRFLPTDEVDSSPPTSEFRRLIHHQTLAQRATTRRNFRPVQAHYRRPWLRSRSSIS